MRVDRRTSADGLGLGQAELFGYLGQDEARVAERARVKNSGGSFRLPRLLLEAS
jgi:hypothetical protein